MVDIPYIKNLAIRLIGTTGSSDLEDEINDLSLEESKYFDKFAIRCDFCEWWFNAYDIEDTGTKFICYECKREEE